MISVVAFMYVPYISKERQETQSRALKTFVKYPHIVPVAIDFKGETNSNEELDSLGIQKINVLDNKRNSKKTIGNTRDLPYIKDIFNILSKIKCDNIGYTNSDILFCQDTAQLLNIGFESYLFSRMDIPPGCDIEEPYPINGINKSHSGMDSCFFNKSWWFKNRDLFPNDLVVGESEWDTCYRHIAKKNSLYVEARTILHNKHNPQWNLKSPGAINNIQIWEDVKRRFK